MDMKKILFSIAIFTYSSFLPKTVLGYTSSYDLGGSSFSAYNIGDTTFFSGDISGSAYRIGGTTFYNIGNSSVVAYDIGDTTFYSGDVTGSSYRIGDTAFHNIGNSNFSSYNIGDTTFFSGDVSGTAYKIGGTTFYNVSQLPNNYSPEHILVYKPLETSNYPVSPKDYDYKNVQQTTTPSTVYNNPSSEAATYHQSYVETISIIGGFSYLGQGVSYNITFPKNGGDVSGTLEGSCHDSVINGKFTGGNGGRISGSISTWCGIAFIQQHLTADYTGTVSLTNKRVDLHWTGNIPYVGGSGSFSLNFGQINTAAQEPTEDKKFYEDQQATQKARLEQDCRNDKSYIEAERDSKIQNENIAYQQALNRIQQSFDMAGLGSSGARYRAEGLSEATHNANLNYIDDLYNSQLSKLKAKGCNF